MKKNYITGVLVIFIFIISNLLHNACGFVSKQFFNINKRKKLQDKLLITPLFLSTELTTFPQMLTREKLKRTSFLFPYFLL